MAQSEKQFEDEIKRLAPVLKSRYYKIPDTHMINKENRHKHKEDKRPFDGVLVTPYGNYCVECKVGNNKLTGHQEETMKRINEINESFVVLSRKITKKTVVYKVENGKQTKEFSNLLDMLKFTCYQTY